jgi:hypothetical protein
MRLWIVLVLWLVIGIAVWNGFFDLYISRGARLYLQLQAESKAGLGSPPSMGAVMAGAKHSGLVAASAWAALVTGAGWATAAWSQRGRSSRVRSE